MTTQRDRAFRRVTTAPRLLRHLSFQHTRNALRLLAKRDFATLRYQLSLLSELGEGSASRLDGRSSVVLEAEPWPDTRPLVSVIIVCFNYGAYVTRALESVLAQTAASLCEVIVVDGGSTDRETVQLVRELAETPPSRTRVFLRDGRHLVGDNRNFGIARARGRYVACLDADDMLDSRYIEAALYLLERRGFDVVSTATQCFGDSRARWKLPLRPDLKRLAVANCVSTVAVYRRALWEAAGGYHDSGLGESYVYEDWKFWHRLAALGARITNIQAPLFHYRVHSRESLSRQGGRVSGRHAQRSAVLEHNADVHTPKAVALSAMRSKQEVIVEGALENLKFIDEAHLPTILLAVPSFSLGGLERGVRTATTQLSEAGFRPIVAAFDHRSVEFEDPPDWLAKATSESYQVPWLVGSRYAADFLEYLVDAKHVDVLLVAGSELAYGQVPALRREHGQLHVVDLLTAEQARPGSVLAPGDVDAHVCENDDVHDALIARGEGVVSIIVLDGDSGAELSRLIEGLLKT